MADHLDLDLDLDLDCRRIYNDEFFLEDIWPEMEFLGIFALTGCMNSLKANSPAESLKVVQSEISTSELVDEANATHMNDEGQMETSAEQSTTIFMSENESDKKSQICIFRNNLMYLDQMAKKIRPGVWFPLDMNFIKTWSTSAKFRRVFRWSHYLVYELETGFSDINHKKSQRNADISFFDLMKEHPDIDTNLIQKSVCSIGIMFEDHHSTSGRRESIENKVTSG